LSSHFQLDFHELSVIKTEINIVSSSYNFLYNFISTYTFETG
jgi:hypothetical protein